MGDLKLEHPPPIATMPLGTGNNLPFSFGWVSLQLLPLVTVTLKQKDRTCLPHVRNSSEIDMPGGSLAGQEESRHRCELSAKVYEGGVDCHPLACGQVIPEAHRMMVSWKRTSNSMMVMNIY
jgi:hypothetical protein